MSDIKGSRQRWWRQLSPVMAAFLRDRAGTRLRDGFGFDVKVGE